MKNYSDKLNDLKKNIKLNELNVNVVYTKHLKNGNLIINCDEEFKKIIEQQLLLHKNKYRIEENKKILPKIKIVGIGNIFNFQTYDEIAAVIKQKNFKDIDGNFKIDYIYNNTKKILKLYLQHVLKKFLPK